MGGEKNLTFFKQRMHAPDYQLIVYIGVLMLLGLIVMYAIGPQRAQALNSIGLGDFSGSYFAIKQLVSLAAAVVAFTVLATIPLSLVYKHAGKIVVAGLGASAILFLFGNLIHVEQIVQCSLGACRWFELGPLGTFQPAELLKFGILIFVARLLAQKMSKGQVNSWDETLIPLLAVVGTALLFVILLQKDMGTGISLTAIVASMMLVAGVNTRNGLRLLAGVLVAGVLMIAIAPHRIERVATLFSGDNISEEQADGSAYHIRQAMIAIGSGGFIGVGVGNSVQTTGYLPEAINDSMFAVLGEMFGFVGLFIIILLMTGLLLRILRVADRVNDAWLRLIVAGVFGWLAAHIILNIASMLGIFPLTGITLPLLSFGGTSMVFIAGALGLVFQASRLTSHRKLEKELGYANLDRGRRLRRTRNTSSGRH